MSANVTTSTAIRDRIAAAIAATREVIAGYFEKTLAQRAGTVGSIYPGLTAEQIEAAITAAVWEPYSHENVQPGCTAFRAPLPGQLGIVPLAGLGPEAVVVLDDRKNKGTVSATVAGVRGEEVNFTILILGQEQGREVVYTFHPGEPVVPSTVTTQPGLHGKVTTVGEALAMGLTSAKIV